MRKLFICFPLLLCTITYSQKIIRNGENVRIGNVFISSLRQHLTIDIQSSDFVCIQLDSDRNGTIMKGSGSAKGKECFPIEIGIYTVTVFENGLRYRKRFKII